MNFLFGIGRSDLQLSERERMLYYGAPALKVTRRRQELFQLVMAENIHSNTFSMSNGILKIL